MTLPDFPTPHMVGTHKYSSLGRDDYNRERPVYTPPEGEEGTQQPVHGWANPRSDEPKIAGHDRVTVDVELFAPKTFDVGPHDLVDLPNFGQFEVVGHPEDYTNGPFDPGYGGLVVNLRRVEG